MSDRVGAGRRSLLVGLVGILLASGFAASELSKVSWDATHFAAFGEDATVIRAYAEDRLGPVSLRPQLGHDGRFFFVQANDPWVIDPADNAELLDRPLYRSQRMLYPALAGGLGLFGPEVIVWAMLLINLMAMGFGTWAVASIASSMGGSAWWGLAFLFNLGFASELIVGGAGVVAGAAAFGALAFLMHGQLWPGIAMLTLAALSREVMLVVAAGVAFYLWRNGERRRATLAFAVPFGAVVGWALYLRARISIEPDMAEIQEVGVPFVGILQAFASWIDDPFDLLVGLAVLLALGLFVRRTLAHSDLLGWAFLGFVPLAAVLTEQVWHSYFDITRAIAPVLTAFVLLVALGGGSASEKNSIGGVSEIL